MGRMVASLANKPHGSLSSNTEKNMKEQANTITLRSGRQVEQLQSQNIDADSLDMAIEDNRKKTKKSDDSAVQQTADLPSEWLNRSEDEVAPKSEHVKKAPVNPYVPQVLFPQRLRK